MIIKGRSRANPGELATHLLRADTNEHVEIIEVRGTVATDVRGALREMCAVAAGSACKKNLYHGSINVRISERLDIEQWRFTIDALEKRLGLIGQPRVVVMHEKRTREHVHIVWSRIDPVRMCAISDSWNYRANEEVAREMERTFGHERVQGAHAERGGVDRPRRTRRHAEMQQAERTKVDVSAFSSELTDLWNATDGGTAFHAALTQKGYLLARGDRRQFVVVDRQGGAHSLARRVDGVRTADVRSKLSCIDPIDLPSVGQARSQQLEHIARANGRAASPETIVGVFREPLRT
jgi:Relaxase/Mobilisation nuclease domain